MLDSENSEQLGTLPKGLRNQEAFLKIKALIWNDTLESLTIQLEEAEQALVALENKVLGLQREKKRCMKRILEFSLKMQEGQAEVEGPLKKLRAEADEIGEALGEAEYARDLAPQTIRAIEDQFVLSLLDALYTDMNHTMERRESTVAEIDTLREQLKGLWTDKFAQDAKLNSFNVFLNATLSKDQLDYLDHHYLKGRE